jgi:hypothetical protein
MRDVDSQIKRKDQPTNGMTLGLGAGAGSWAPHTRPDVGGTLTGLVHALVRLNARCLATLPSTGRSSSSRPAGPIALGQATGRALRRRTATDTTAVPESVSLGRLSARWVWSMRRTRLVVLANRSGALVLSFGVRRDHHSVESRLHSEAQESSHYRCDVHGRQGPHEDPNTPAKDGDLHIADRAPEVNLPTVGEIMNAKDSTPGRGRHFMRPRGTSPQLGHPLLAHLETCQPAPKCCSGICRTKSSSWLSDQ